VVEFAGVQWQGEGRGRRAEDLNVRLKDIVDDGRRTAVQLAEWLARQDRALHNARKASTEVSQRRVEHDEIEIYLDSLQTPSKNEWATSSARAAD
jgi:hypothetical protein